MSFSEGKFVMTRSAATWESVRILGENGLPRQFANWLAMTQTGTERTLVYGDMVQIRNYGSNASWAMVMKRSPKWDRYRSLR